MKPIEPGCMAWTYNCWNPANNGKVVKCIKFIGKVDGWEYKDRWEIDTKMYSVLTNEEHYHTSERTLLRIDGYEDDKRIEEIAKELVK